MTDLIRLVFKLQKPSGLALGAHTHSCQELPVSGRNTEQNLLFQLIWGKKYNNNYTMKWIKEFSFSKMKKVMKKKNTKSCIDPRPPELRATMLIATLKNPYYIIAAVHSLVPNILVHLTVFHTYINPLLKLLFFFSYNLWNKFVLRSSQHAIRYVLSINNRYACNSIHCRSSALFHILFSSTLFVVQMDRILE